MAHSKRNLRFNVPNEIPVVFYKESNYDYHFIIKEFESERKFECFGENYKNFSVPIEKEAAKTIEERIKNIIKISYKIKFIDSARFMTSSLFHHYV